MGAEEGPRVIVGGAVDALASAPGRFEVILVGREDSLRSHLPGPVDGLQVVDAPDVIGMSESPAAAIRAKKNSSIAVAIRLVKEKGADALVSAGNTGAVVAGSLVTLGRLAGVSRPAIATIYPTKKSGAVVLDVGANSECTPKNLHQFAHMGEVFARYNLKIDSPRVGLLNIGEERSKGNSLVRESYEVLERDDRINFIGNVEGRDVFDGAADVVVCDGFVGNILLKFSESIYSFMAHMMRKQARRGFVSRAGALLMRRAFRSLRSELDYAEYGGAPLLGVNGVVIISHGKSSKRAIQNAILVAARSVEAELNRHIQKRLKGSVENVANAS